MSIPVHIYYVQGPYIHCLSVLYCVYSPCYVIAITYRLCAYVHKGVDKWGPRGLKPPSLDNAMGQWGHKKQESKLCSSFKAPPTLKSYLSAQIAPRIPMGPQLHPFIIIAESIRMHIYQSKNLKLNFWVTSSCSRHRWQMANIIIQSVTYARDFSACNTFSYQYQQHLSWSLLSVTHVIS